MSYRVEVSTVFHPGYSQEGPDLESFDAASAFFATVTARSIIGLTGVRLRDLARDPAHRDPIIMSVERPHAR